MSDQNQQNRDEKAKNSKEEAKRKNVFEEFGDSVERFASKTFETIKETIDKSLNSRNTVLTIRVNEEANHKLNMLVNAGIFKSRSESAAFLIEEGIKHQAGLFERIEEKLRSIEKIKEELKDIITDEMSGQQTVEE
jgi:Arc/MetJ-type ribon-helix-helix transcriptional regulator